MTIDAGPDAGGFEPRQMKFYQVSYPTTSFGQAVPATRAATAFCTRPFRYQKTYGRETTDVGMTKALRTTVIEVRRDRKTEALTENMQAVLGGVSYGITSIQPKANSSTLLVITLESVQPASVAPEGP